jgi:hypothetical protein
MIPRDIKTQIEEKLFKNKAIIITGPRQTGKTTLINNILQPYQQHTLYLDGDDPTVIKLLDRPNTEQIKQLIGNNKIVFIDEAQRINDVGITAKIIVDQLKDKQVVVSGSSSFELTQQTHEPLTGRKWTFNLWPVSWNEWQYYTGFLKAEQDLENRIVFGLYPDVLNNREEAVRVLKELTDSYLYKDVLMYGAIKKPGEIKNLLQALAYQIGNEVSYRELSSIVGIDPKTIAKYIDILEKAFVIIKLTPFSRNLRNEIKSNHKIYFYDNGIRNALIGQLQPLSIRQDTGALWENFLISERKKRLTYTHALTNSYFWRTTQQQEIDYIEETEGNIYGYEFKWNPKNKAKFPKTFVDKYQATCHVVHRDNFRDFIVY